MLTSKYAEHTPLYRQSEIYARQDVALSRSVLSGWVDACCRLLPPLGEALQRYVLSDGKLHADDTPVPVLLPGNKKTKNGRRGPTFAMTATRVRPNRLRSGLPTARTGKVSIHKLILLTLAAYYRRMRTTGSMSCIAMAA